VRLSKQIVTTINMKIAAIKDYQELEAVRSYSDRGQYHPYNDSAGDE